MANIPADGSRIWITGASSGIGKAMLEALDDADVATTGVARREPPMLLGRPRELAWLRADLSAPSGWAKVAASFDEALSARRGGDAVLVHAAGTAAPLTPASYADPEEYERAVLLNFASPAILAQRFLRAARLNETRATVLLVSTGTTTGDYPGWSVYRPGKAAINEWVTTVAGERPTPGDDPDFAVFAIAPGGTDTPMQEVVRGADPSAFPRVEKFQDLARTGGLRPVEEVAAQLWRLIMGDLEPGSVVDVRDL